MSVTTSYSGINIQRCYRRHCYVRTAARNYAAARTIQTRFYLVQHLFAEERALESRLLATGTIQQWYRGILSTLGQD